MGDNKQLTPTAPTLHWTLPFCIALCSVEVFGSVVLVERRFALGFGDDAAQRKSTCKKLSTLLKAAI